MSVRNGGFFLNIFELLMLSYLYVNLLNHQLFSFLYILSSNFYFISDAAVHNVYEEDDSNDVDDVMAIQLSDDHPPILVEGA